MAKLDEILMDRAAKAAAAATSRLEMWLDYEDFQDARQSAALGFWKGWRAKPELSEDRRIAYAYGAAVRQAIQFIIRRLFANNPSDDKLEALDEFVWGLEESPPQSEIPDLSPEIRRRLYEIFYSSRKKKGDRGRMAAMREVFIINAVHRGDSDDAIAVDLDLPREHVKAYRLQARARLEQYCKEEGIDV